MITKEKDWRELFTVQEVDNYQLKTEIAGDCTENCQDAKELKCTCRCLGKNHGSHLKACVKPLDTYIEKICPHCNGEGCRSCNQTGAVQIQVTSATFYQGGEQ